MAKLSLKGKGKAETVKATRYVIATEDGEVVGGFTMPTEPRGETASRGIPYYVTEGDVHFDHGGKSVALRGACFYVR